MKKAGGKGGKSGKPQASPAAMGGPSGGGGDDRFKRIQSDPRFQRMPKADKKVKVDKRFQGMFTDKRFKMDFVVDKTGRKIQTDQYGDDLKRFYDVDGEAEGDEGGEGDESEAVQGSEAEGDAESGGEGDEEGEGGEGDEGDSDSSSDVDSEVERDLANAEYEEVEEVEIGDATSRLALLNMEWDNLKSVDILVLLNSFLKPGCIIKKVSVFPSEFGLKEMEREGREGPNLKGDEPAASVEDIPKENEDKDSDDDSDDSDREDIDKVDMDRLRAYELNRLKYFYAVVECDNVKTAMGLYEEVDGMEFETSSNVMDCRYVPEGQVFERASRDTATKVPAKYEAPKFYTKALQQTKFELTWDREDPARQQAFSKSRASKESWLDEDLEAYIGSEEDDDGYGTDAVVEASDSEADEDADGKVALKRRARSKFSSILGELQPKKKGPEAGNVEITFEPGLKDAGSNLLTSMEEKKKLENESVWESYLRKRAEKKKDKKKARKEKIEKLKKGENPDESEDSDSEEGADGLTKDEMDDSFFADAFEGEEFEESGKGKDGKKKAKAKEDKKKGKKGKVEEPEAEAEDAGELELLLMEKEDDKKGYDLKQLLRENKTSKLSDKAKKRKSKKGKKGQDDDGNDESFALDTVDSRFGAVFEKPEFAIDPNHHMFKQTAGMDQMLETRRARSKAQKEESADKAKANKKLAAAAASSSGDAVDSSSSSSDISSLVASMKKKNASFNKKSLAKGPSAQEAKASTAPATKKRKTEGEQTGMTETHSKQKKKKKL
jgi:hypothetical protein